MLKAPEYEQFRVFFLQFGYLRENIIACFDGTCQCIATYITIVVRITILIFVVRPVGLVVGRYLICIIKVCVIDVSSYNPVPTIQRKVEGYDTQRTCYIIVFRTWCAQGVAEGIAVIATQSDAQSLY